MGDSAFTLKEGEQLNEEERKMRVADYWMEGEGWNWTAFACKLSMTALVKLAGVSLCSDLIRQDRTTWSTKKANSFSVRAAYELANGWMEEDTWAGWSLI